MRARRRFIGFFLVVGVVIGFAVSLHGQDAGRLRFASKEDVFRFDPDRLLDHTAQDPSLYGSWKQKRFFLICNPRLKKLDYLTQEVVDGPVVFSQKGAGTDLHDELLDKIKVFGDSLGIPTRESLGSCIDSLESPEWEFLVLAVDLPSIAIGDAGRQSEMETCLTFKLFRIKFASGSTLGSWKLDRCEFVYGDSETVSRRIGDRPVDALGECIIIALQRKLVHSLVARVYGSQNSPWNPQKNRWEIPVPGPSISLYLKHEAWMRVCSAYWKQQRGEWPTEVYARAKEESKIK
jgi:hypothetical protein